MYLGYVPRRSWTTEERHAAKNCFVEEINKGIVPSMEKCRLTIKNKEELKMRTPIQLRTWIKHHIKMKHNSNSGNKIKNIHTFSIQCLENFSVLDYKRRSWSTPEKKLCRKIFGQDVEKGIYPSKEKICNVLEKYPEFQNRTPAMIISHLQHVMNSKKES